MGGPGQKSQSPGRDQAFGSNQNRPNLEKRQACIFGTAEGEIPSGPEANRTGGPVKGFAQATKDVHKHWVGPPTWGQFMDTRHHWHKYRDPRAADLMQQTMSHQHQEAQQAAHEEGMPQYKEWLQQGQQKGLRGLFRSLKSSEVAWERPYRQIPMPQKMDQRLKDWSNLWHIKQDKQPHPRVSPQQAVTGTAAPSVPDHGGFSRATNTAANAHGGHAAPQTKPQIEPSRSSSPHKSPQVASVMRDLGVDHQAARRRRIPVIRQRMNKTKQRKLKLRTLKIPALKVRLRLHRGGIQPVALCTIEGQGLAPRYRTALKQAMASGSSCRWLLASTYDIHSNKYMDPADQILAHHIKATHTLYRAWPTDQMPCLKQAWHEVHQQLQVKQYPWYTVRDPRRPLSPTWESGNGKYLSSDDAHPYSWRLRSHFRIHGGRLRRFSWLKLKTNEEVAWLSDSIISI